MVYPYYILFSWSLLVSFYLLWLIQPEIFASEHQITHITSPCSHVTASSAEIKWKLHRYNVPWIVMCHTGCASLFFSFLRSHHITEKSVCTYISLLSFDEADLTVGVCARGSVCVHDCTRRVKKRDTCDRNSIMLTIYFFYKNVYTSVWKKKGYIHRARQCVPCCIMSIQFRLFFTFFSSLLYIFFVEVIELYLWVCVAERLFTSLFWSSASFFRCHLPFLFMKKREMMSVSEQVGRKQHFHLTSHFYNICSVHVTVNIYFGDQYISKKNINKIKSRKICLSRMAAHRGLCLCPSP